ncbi:hypothetical protein IscW_ISCW009635 [Ixodes scapularis]|uniref:Uncharacterized protein n=1 Tax=Ixodes scapularis TaxID=6945 RepID=B7PZ03_IXOSC|nr:hypothetical protein IscW_ISCW009635 [Ixodes scapularis]|eukprot:XP_002404288.1 hypothetical protein IscW_ISCW009635 [Ixodes scapularis]
MRRSQIADPPEACASGLAPSKPCRNGLQGTNACPRYIPRSPGKPHGGDCSEGGIGGWRGTTDDGPEFLCPDASPDSPPPSPKSSWMANGDRWGPGARCMAPPL